MNKNLYSTEPTVYDKADVYEKKVRPLVTQILQICQVNQMPFVCTCATQNNAHATHYENDGILTGSNGINLHDDRFTRVLLCMNGAALARAGAIDFGDSTIQKIYDSLPEDAEEQDEYMDEHDAEESAANALYEQETLKEMQAKQRQARASAELYSKAGPVELPGRLPAATMPEPGFEASVKVSTEHTFTHSDNSMDGVLASIADLKQAVAALTQIVRAALPSTAPKRSVIEASPVREYTLHEEPSHSSAAVRTSVRSLPSAGYAHRTPPVSKPAPVPVTISDDSDEIDPDVLDAIAEQRKSVVSSAPVSAEIPGPEVKEPEAKAVNTEAESAPAETADKTAPTVNSTADTVPVSEEGTKSVVQEKNKPEPAKKPAMKRTAAKTAKTEAVQKPEKDDGKSSVKKISGNPAVRKSSKNAEAAKPVEKKSRPKTAKPKTEPAEKSAEKDNTPAPKPKRRNNAAAAVSEQDVETKKTALKAKKTAVPKQGRASANGVDVMGVFDF